MPFSLTFWESNLLVFFITVVFLQYNSTVVKLRLTANTSTSARSKRRYPLHRSKGLNTMDINPSLQILGSFDKGAGVRWRDQAKINKKSELVHCLRCHLFGATPPWSTWLREGLACNTRHPDLWHAMSGMLTSLPTKLTKIGMRVKTLSDLRHKLFLRVVLRRELAK